MKDRDVRFHEEWLGLAQPIEGLVFSVPVLADAQIAPEVAPDLSSRFSAELAGEKGSERIVDLAVFFERFLGYSAPGMRVSSDALPDELSFYAAEGGQEIRPTFALGRGPFVTDDPFAAFEVKAEAPVPSSTENEPYWALIWDLSGFNEKPLNLDESESSTGPWRYPPTAKFERLLRQVGIPVGFIANGKELRLVYAPLGETTAHLTFRVRDLAEPAGRPILAALELLVHARRAYSASSEFTLEGLLRESRRRQADVTDALAKQVFEAVEILIAGFESAASRLGSGELDWLRPALEADQDHFYQGVLSVVLRLVFLLYAEDQSLMPVGDETYAAHLSVAGLYQRLSHDASSHPESMHHRFGAYGHLLALFRAVYFGVKHGNLELPPRRGRLFDPNAYPFLEGGQPDWTAAVIDPSARARVIPPCVDDGTLYDVLHRLVVFEGQRLSYRTLDVEQIGSVYESLMGYHVLRTASPAVRVGKLGVWVETSAVTTMNAADRARFFKEACALSSGPAQTLEKALQELIGSASKKKTTTSSDDEIAEVLAAHAQGKKGDVLRHRVDAGRLVLQPGEERRRTGSHYTPRSLTEKVVKRTLEPLLLCLGPDEGENARRAEQILELKICDPAMGSGAFLVAACRELASELVKAWTRSGELASMIEVYGDAHLHARRLVAQRCLYGVDKNAAAVELAKLSLWLVTLDKALPFTFVDHSLRHGDSLVGLDFEQIAAFHWSVERRVTKPTALDNEAIASKPAKKKKKADLATKQTELVSTLLRDALDEAVSLRQELLALADHEDSVSQVEKRRLFEFSQQSIDRVRLVADVCVGAFFAETSDAGREAERRRRLDIIERWILNERAALDVTADALDPEALEKATRLADEARATVEELAQDARKKLAPFHWWLEFPEVFFSERPDPLQQGTVNGAALMEGVVGNPPFGGKNNIGDANTEGYLDWLKVISPGAHGNSDLSAHFFRRAAALLGEHGAFGLIATNTIAQGDTRATGLRYLMVQGWHLFEATRTLAWPGAAAVTVSLVHGAHGRAVGLVESRLDGRATDVINSRLRPKQERADPQPQSANAGSAFVGSYVLGMGFTLTVDERDALVKNDPKNGARIIPYLGGEEVNTSPNQVFDRYVISFGQMELASAECWPELIRIVREKVKPERDKNNRENYQKLWWRFGEGRPGLYAATAPLQRCLVTARVSKHLLLSFQPTNRIFSEQLYVFPLDCATAFSVLQSRVHEPWARLLSSSMKTDLRYSASDCFETFPFPSPEPRSLHPALETIGEELYEDRARFMVERSVGLTKTYNALKDPASTDPAILALRSQHEALDRAVLAAYGWDDITVPPYCPKDDADREAVQAFEDEVIDRLYVLNAERAREEQRLGLEKDPAMRRKPRPDDRKASKTPKPEPTPTKGRSGEGQGDLF